MGIDVSVIIVNYNTSHLIVNCLRSIILLTEGISFEVIIVDNNSEPDIKEKICRKVPEATQENFHFINLPENIGFGRANNEGIKIAKGRNIFFLNPDTLLINNAIKILSDFLDSNQRAGACGGNVYDENKNPSFSFWRLYPGMRDYCNSLLKYYPEKIIFQKNNNFNFSNVPLKVATIIGADLMVKVKVLNNTGGFDPDFFMFYEETDLCRRIRRAGYYIFNVPSAKIIHLEGRSFSSETFPTDKRMRMRETGRRIYFKKNHNKVDTFFSNFLYRLNLQMRYIFTTNVTKKDYFKRKLRIFNE